MIFPPVVQGVCITSLPTGFFLRPIAKPVIPPRPVLYKKLISVNSKTYPLTVQGYVSNRCLVKRPVAGPPSEGKSKPAHLRLVSLLPAAPLIFFAAPARTGVVSTNF